METATLGWSSPLGEETAALLPRSLDAFYGMVYGLIAAATDGETVARALEIIERLKTLGKPTP